MLAILILVAVSAGPLFAAFDFESLDGLPPGEQYRQLSLLSLVASGIDPALLDSLRPLEERLVDGATGGQDLSLDDLVTPLVRIVDQDEMLADVAGMLRFARANSEAMQARMTAIARNHPILISMVDVNALTEDAIIMRNAIADAIEYSDVLDDPALPELVQGLREQTVHLRNMMEFNQFQEELAIITEEAIIDLGGRLDAYQRMFDDEVDADLIKRRVESAEIMNRQAGDHYQERALENNSELLMMLILMESQVY